MEDNKIDELFNLGEEQTEVNQINKRINKKIYRKINKVLISILVVLLIGLYGMNLIMKQINYNPYAEDVSMFEEMNADDPNCDPVGVMQSFLIDTYIRVTQPGVYYDSHFEIKDKGFGNYELYGRLDRMFEGVVIGGGEKYQLSQSTYELNNTEYLGRFLSTEPEHRFELDKQIYLERRPEMLAEIEKMPESSQFEVYVSYDEAIALTDWHVGNVSDYKYVFALTKTFGQKNCGFNLYPATIRMVNEYYPSYDITHPFHELTSEELYEHYESLLQVLLDHPDFVDAFSKTDKAYSYLEELMAQVKNKSVNIYGYLAYVSKEEMIEILNDENSEYVSIFDVKYSSFER